MVKRKPSKKKKGKKEKKNIVGRMLNSLPAQFIIGGLTVAGIAYFSNNASDPAIAGLIGALPIGMPSSVFVADSKVEAYAYHLMLMTIPLMLGTILNWFLIAKMKYTKYKSVGASLLLFVIVGALLVFMNKKKH